MKTTGAVTVFQLVIYLWLIAITASSVVAGEKEAVLDTNGHPLFAHAPYLVKIQSPNGTAWISKYPINTADLTSCPQRVVSMSDEIVGIYIPIEFILSSDEDVVRVSTELNIRFPWADECEESGIWRVADSSLPVKEVVMSGSDSSNDSTFSIQKSDNGTYKFAFGSADKPKDIGLDVIGHGLWRLILSNNSGFAISFVPAF
ncbi:unnamed protein product [Eruca vesicaria subsp. sativa]|uniref:Uncharacterized protein n=1 Tax=Eruca vesicaria subsp. sativa TaxID=29727 RepID=A0ABC8LB49_ERUVS|nr:unnamed protein product [Eruca vesicaria subsp. sativa]